MSEVAKLVDSVAAALRPTMKQHGYAKRGRTFRKRGDACVQVLNVQSSPWNLGDSGSFTVNLGLYFPAVAIALYEVEEAADNPPESSCHLRMRLGQLMPRPYDRWWDIKVGISTASVAEEVVAAVRDFGIAWLETHNTLESALLAAYPGRRLTELEIAGFYVALGQPEDAVPWLRQSVDRMLALDRPHLAERWSAWGQRHGVVIV